MTLEEKLKYYADNYYKGNELISDEEYDALVEQYKKETFNPIEIIGDDFNGNKKYKLPMTMGTLEKCHTEEELEKWYDKHSNKELVIQAKCDGNSQLLIYKNGEFIQSLSRGNSFEGLDTTHNMLKVKFPKKINISFNGYIRGEVICKNSVFAKHFAGEKNPRNTAAGKIASKSGDGCEYLSFIAYDIKSPEFISETQKIDFLRKNGFDTPFSYKVENIKQIFEMRNKLEYFVKQNDYGMDGLVIKENETSYEDLSRKTPTTQIAFKPEPKVKETVIKEIKWQLAGAELSPVAIIEPVVIDEATIERVSLHNVNIMKEKGITVGAKVLVKRSGMVIPEIIRVVEAGAKELILPNTCPACGEKLTLCSDGILKCLNENCSRKIAHSIKKSLSILKIKGAGEAFVANAEKEVQSLSHFFEILLNDSKTVRKWAGGINGDKICKQFKAIKELTVSEFLALHDYRGLGVKKLDQLNFKTLDEALHASMSQILNVKGFNSTMASIYISFLNDKKDDIEACKKYFKIKSESETSVVGKFKELSFCFTGSACKPRKELEKIVVENGGIVKSSVSRGLSYLVTDDVNSCSSKNVKAKELNIPVISSTEFLKMVE